MNLRAPDTLEPADTWRKQAECAKPEYVEDRSVWFPHRADKQTEQHAKTICTTRCPVTEQCAAWAISHHIDHGVWGGLAEAERRRIHKRHTWKLQNPAFRASVVAAAINAAMPTLRDAYQQRTAPAGDGHTRWTVSSSSVTVRRIVYTPMQLAFALGHGRRAEGTVRAECGVTGCVTPEHLCDGRIRREQRLAKRAAV